MDTLSTLWSRSYSAVKEKAGPLCERLAERLRGHCARHTAQIRERPAVALGVAFGVGVVAARLIRK